MKLTISSLVEKRWPALVVGFVALFVATAGPATAQVPAPVEPPAVPMPLNRITVPDVNKLGLLDCTGLGLVNGACGNQYPGFPITKPGQQETLIALGKALFWDMQIGSDGIQACASCHFHAGADNRIRNQVSPGLNRVAGTQVQITNAINPSQLTPNEDSTFTAGFGPNGTLTGGQFPFAVTGGTNFGNNDIVSSQGVNDGIFTALSGGRVETGNYANVDPHGFNASGNTVRRVPPRNSPTTIGAVYNLRNFWDGRANLFFNGVNPFGMLDPNARVNTTTGQIQLMIPFSSLASQAVGPPLSDFEMSLTNRTFQHIAEKVLRPLPIAEPPTPGFIPLDRQAVATTDSALAPYTTGVGLSVSYIDFIKDVFQPKFWSKNDGSLNIDLMRSNFALFFGVAVQAYEATLVPDQTPVDTLLRNLNGAPPNPTGSAIERGLAVFLSGRTGCSTCHFGSETTSASVSHLTGFGDPALEAAAVGGVPVPRVALAERMQLGDGSRAAYDTGFYNIGVRPTADDLSVFNRVNNVPFSFGMLAQEILRGNPSVVSVNQLLLSGNLRLPTASTNLAPLDFAITVACAPGGRGQARGLVNGQGCQPLRTNEHVAIRGSFKTPGLRNLKFTGPYMHNGSLKSIREVIDFYNVGGHFNLAFNPDNCRNNNRNTCIIGQVDFDADIEGGRIHPEEIDDVIAFLRDGLTDDRVAKEQAPFDHPQLCLPNGHHPNGSTIFVDLPAVGAGGHRSEILTFEQTLNGGGSNEQHALNTPCGIGPPPTQN